ncbi:hypothetical protein PG994_004953 [Apiospora phragmitis]|uniref:Uncharacterized protein n=1 Tax=Apiospora phragmitis TaxID=2905665 RepID=A0ABR1VS17_9PEZI
MTHNIPVADERTQGVSLSPDPSRTAHHQVSNPTLNINVDKANSQSSDTEDIYDATPRKVRSPGDQIYDSKNNHAVVVGAAAVGGAAVGITVGTASQEDMAHTGSYFVEPPNGGNHDPTVGGSPSVATGSSTPAVLGVHCHTALRPYGRATATTVPATCGA